MFSVLTSKLFGGLSIALVIACAVLWWQGSRYKAQRDDLAAWQTDVTAATRSAAHRPKLATKNVAQQIRYLGEGLDKVRLNMARVKADALAAKLAEDERNERRRKDADHAYDAAIVDARRRTDDYARNHIVRGKSDPPGANRGDNRSGDMPSPAFGPGRSEGAGSGTELVAVPRSDLDICTINTERLKVAVDWAE